MARHLMELHGCRSELWIWMYCPPDELTDIIIDLLFCSITTILASFLVLLGASILAKSKIQNVGFLKCCYGVAMPAIFSHIFMSVLFHLNLAIVGRVVIVILSFFLAFLISRYCLKFDKILAILLSLMGLFIVTPLSIILFIPFLPSYGA
jgi:hypothetical protein